MIKDRKIGKFFGIVLLVLVLLVAGSLIAFKIYTSHYYATDTVAFSQIADEYAGKVDVFSNDSGMAFFPGDKNFRGIIVFYPGGKVEYTAYSALMYELSARGFICLLPKMPENLAFLSIRAVDYLMPGDEEIRKKAGEMDWYMAGHSLGGVAASKYLADAFEDSGEKPELPGDVEGGLGRFKGLILCGSYPASDLSSAPIRLLSIYGSNDRVLNRKSYEASRSNWPADSTEEVIEGGNHASFGTYGKQEGDGEATISNEQQIKITAEIIDNWIGN